VQLGPGIGVEDKEQGRDAVADPDAEPGLPPGQPAGDHRRGDHESVEVERVGEPEGPVVPRLPLAVRERDGQDVVVLEERGGAVQAGRVRRLEPLKHP